MGHVVRRHRRPLAALLAALAVLATVSALSRPPAELAWAVVTTRPVTAGAILEAADLTAVRLPVGALPDSRVTAPADVVGRVVSIALPRNAVVVPGAVVARDRPSAQGLVIVPVTLVSTADGLVRTGDRIDLIGTDTDGHAQALASAALVVAVPATGGGGLLSGATPSSGLVLVEVAPDVATRIAESADRGPLSFALH